MSHITMSSTLTPSKFHSELPTRPSPSDNPYYPRPGITSEPSSPERRTGVPQPRQHHPAPAARPAAFSSQAAAYTGFSSYFPDTGGASRTGAEATHSSATEYPPVSHSYGGSFNTSHAAPEPSLSWYQGAVSHPSASQTLRLSQSSDIVRYSNEHHDTQVGCNRSQWGEDVTHGSVAISFPKTRTVLWDSTPIGTQFDVSPTAVLPRVAVAKSAIESLARNLDINGHGLFSFLVGHETHADTIDGYDVWGRGSDGPRIHLDACHLSSDDHVPSRRRGIAVTVLHKSDVSFVPAETLSIDETEFTSMLDELDHQLRSRQGVSPASLFRTRLIACHNTSTQSLALAGSMVCPSTAFRLTPLNALRITPTTLARNLQSVYHGQQPQSGYLTMDATRKVLTLLDTDPMAYKNPVVGIWVSGVATASDPFVWAAALRYLHCDALTDRAMCNGRFLVLCYGTGSTLPSFFECEPVKRPLPFAHFRFARNINLGGGASLGPVSLHFHTPTTEHSTSFTKAIRARGFNEDNSHLSTTSVSTTASSYLAPREQPPVPTRTDLSAYEIVATSAPSSTVYHRGVPAPTQVYSSAEFAPSRGAAIVTGSSGNDDHRLHERRGSAEAFAARFGPTVKSGTTSMYHGASSMSTSVRSSFDRSSQIPSVRSSVSGSIEPPRHAWPAVPTALTNPHAAPSAHNVVTGDLIASVHDQLRASRQFAQQDLSTSDAADLSTASQSIVQQQQQLQQMINQLMTLQLSLVEQQQSLLNATQDANNTSHAPSEPSSVVAAKDTRVVSVEDTFARTSPPHLHPRIDLQINTTGDDGDDTDYGITDTVFVTQTPPGASSRADEPHSQLKRAPIGRRGSREPGPHSPYDEAVQVDFVPGSEADPTVRGSSNGSAQTLSPPRSKFTFEEGVSSTLPGNSLSHASPARSPLGAHHDVAVPLDDEAADADEEGLIVISSPVRSTRAPAGSSRQHTTTFHDAAPVRSPVTSKSSPARPSYESPIKTTVPTTTQERIPSADAVAAMAFANALSPSVTRQPVSSSPARHGVRPSARVASALLAEDIPRIHYSPVVEEVTEFDSEVLYAKYLGNRSRPEHRPSPSRRAERKVSGENYIFDYEENIIESTEDLLSSLKSVDLTKLE